MIYWLIVAALVILIIVTGLWTAMGIKREHREYREKMKKQKLVSAGRRKADEGRGRNISASLASGKRRWKLILEDLSMGELFDYIFCESVGIGRTTQDVAFEKFLSIPNDRKVSKVHCSVVANRENLYLKDEGSKNHTYLNGKKIHRPILLQKEDVITIGETDLRVVKILKEVR